MNESEKTELGIDQKRMLMRKAGLLNSARSPDFGRRQYRDHDNRVAGHVENVSAVWDCFWPISQTDRFLPTFEMVAE